MGEAQEQAWYELWDHGQSPEVSFDTKFSKQIIYEWPYDYPVFKYEPLPSLLYIQF